MATVLPVALRDIIFSFWSFDLQAETTSSSVSWCGKRGEPRDATKICARATPAAPSRNGEPGPEYLRCHRHKRALASVACLLHLRPLVGSLRRFSTEFIIVQAAELGNQDLASALPKGKVASPERGASAAGAPECRCLAARSLVLPPFGE